MWYEITLGLPPQYTYSTLLLLSIAGPLFLSFDKRVAFYKQWPKLFLPVIVASGFYLLWDIVFTHLQVWHFNPNYLHGINIINLPIEEYGFFIVIPYASAFVYACIKAYFPNLSSAKKLVPKAISYSIITLSILCIATVPTHLYTLVTFALLSLSIAYLEFKQKSYRLTLYISWAICILPMLYVNGVLTGKPVLIYNNAQNLGLRIGTIPFEDFFYHLLYMVILIVILESERKITLRKQNKKM